MMSEFLLELKVEEIPAGLQQEGESGLKKLLHDFLAAHGIEGATLVSQSASSRIAIWSTDMPDRSKDIIEEKIGPKVEAGLDADGKPSRALLGYMNSNGIKDVTELEQRDTSKGKCFAFTKTTPARKTAEILAAGLPGLIRAIAWTKSMRWGDGDVVFVRPIFNILCLLDGQVVPFSVGDLASNNKSFGHFYLSPAAFDVTSVSQYQSELKSRKVMLSRQEREDIIREQLAATAATVDAKVIESDKLIREVAGLIEWPFAVLSAIDDHYLDLPREILVSTMTTHQRYFALEQQNGKLSKNFIGTSNMPDSVGNIATGYRKVLTARFDDAQFYWDQDRKVRLDSLRGNLKGIVFQKDLGSVYEKMERTEKLVEKLQPFIAGLDITKARRIAQLAKCDLSSGVVSEFPELQGIMGSYYAAADGEDAEVCAGLRRQYEYETFAGFGLETLAFIIADRIDTLVGFFGINQKPTGSKDPYALRRASLSLIRLLRHANLRLDMKAFLGVAFDNYHGALKQSREETVDEVFKFMIARLEVSLRDEVSYDLIQAVLAKKDLNDIVDIVNRILALHRLMNDLGGRDLHESFKRANNILGDSKTIDMSASITPALAAEIALYTASRKIEPTVKDLIAKERYIDAMTELSTLTAPMDQFFKEIKVMDDDQAIRNSRLALLKYVVELFNQFADMKLIAA